MGLPQSRLAWRLLLSFHFIQFSTGCDPHRANKGREDQVFCGYFICFQMRLAPSIHACNLKMLPSGPDKTIN